ncbi:hypothetical protein HNY73_010807 [Argiope bruennichi]|uniref:Uncharacterized protein n=1 Tax=Argiope bruennichi TaxID=94029 RepID=A0A8T0F4N0_ARGBR|nr:hypothetical protein HNY73_010807 [Argiope bruennichi]
MLESCLFMLKWTKCLNRWLQILKRIFYVFMKLDTPRASGKDYSKNFQIRPSMDTQDISDLLKLETSMLHK